MKSKTEKTVSKTTSSYDKYDSATYLNLDKHGVDNTNRSNEKKNESPSANVAWILGKMYNLDTDKEEFRSHAESFFRFTYRRDFPALEPYPITSDAGWGCMLRSAQMLMGYALRKHYLGSDWRIPKSNDELLRKNEDYCEILRWFLDFPGFPHIYSIHHLTQTGMKYDKLPGEWYGPSAASYVLRDLSKIHRLRYQGEVAIMVTQGETIYISEVEKLCSNLSLNENFFGLQDSNHLLSNSTFTERFQRLSMDLTSTRKRPNQMIYPTTTPLKARPNLDGKSAEKTELKDPLRISEETSPSETKEPFFDPLFRPPPSQINPWVYSLLLLLPLRLGISSVNEEYISELKDVLQHPACIGILGGRPNHAIYFVGYHSKDNVLYGLDPHTVYANPSGETIYDPSIFPTDEYLHQIHTKDFVTLDIGQLDPSLAIGFYFHDRQEFNDFCIQSRLKSDRLKQQKLSPLYQIEHTAPSYLFEDFAASSPTSTSPTNASEKDSVQRHQERSEKILQSMGIHEDDFEERKNSEDQDDEYVFL